MNGSLWKKWFVYGIAVKNLLSTFIFNSVELVDLSFTDYVKISRYILTNEWHIMFKCERGETYFLDPLFVSM